MTQPDISAAFTGANAITFGSNFEREIHLTQGGPDYDISAYVDSPGGLRAQVRKQEAAGTTGALSASTESADWSVTVAKITVVPKTTGADGRYLVRGTTLETRRMSAQVSNAKTTYFIEVEGAFDGTPDSDVLKLGKGQMEFLPETTVTEAAPATPPT